MINCHLFSVFPGKSKRMQSSINIYVTTELKGLEWKERSSEVEGQSRLCNSNYNYISFTRALCVEKKRQMLLQTRLIFDYLVYNKAPTVIK